MTTESTRGDGTYRVTLDRDACDGVFACLVRDDRFREAADGLATIGEAADEGDALATDRSDGSAVPADADTIVARFADDRLADAEAAAAACPVNAIAVDAATDPAADATADPAVGATTDPAVDPEASPDE
ncbi:ferredoxin [Halopenitus persicus]|uniref:4Fe-4S single cluster domain-containing protein n=1 Tax=Halopenitus persicus TaxID=1048396 RepID=A0A1H3J400_9EURY|nr:ferredoxin [Halopenitus persicus]SDY34315.1 4Fe-4S single cluster domain-containing protein [Halopenitus persicus]